MTEGTARIADFRSSTHSSPIRLVASWSPVWPSSRVDRTNRPSESEYRRGCPLRLERICLATPRTTGRRFRAQPMSGSRSCILPAFPWSSSGRQPGVPPRRRKLDRCFGTTETRASAEDTVFDTDQDFIGSWKPSSVAAASSGVRPAREGFGVCSHSNAFLVGKHLTCVHGERDKSTGRGRSYFGVRRCCCHNATSFSIYAVRIHCESNESFSGLLEIANRRQYWRFASWHSAANQTSHIHTVRHHSPSAFAFPWGLWGLYFEVGSREKAYRNGCSSFHATLRPPSEDQATSASISRRNALIVRMARATPPCIVPSVHS